MNISVKGEYALEAVFDLATQPQGEPIKIADIARRQKIPQKFLELILGSLKQSGIVQSRRGAEGGYKLARPADMITVGEVMRAIEGPMDARTKRRKDVPFCGLWRRVDEGISNVIDKTNFAELAREYQESKTTYVPNWEI